MKKAIRRLRPRRADHHADPGCVDVAVNDDDLGLDESAAESVDAIPGAYERAQAGLMRGLAGDAIPLDDL
jgi:hypothetical protein